MRRFVIAVIVIAVLAASGYFGYTYYSQIQQAQTLAAYQTTVIAKGNLTATIGATGTVRARQSAVLTWQTTGTVGDVGVAEGELVQAGQVLAGLQTSSLNQSIILAKSDLLNAQKSLEDLQQSDASRARAWEAVLNARKALSLAEQAVEKYDKKAYKDSLDKAREDLSKAKDDLKTAEDDFDKYKDYSEDNQTRKDAAQKLTDAQLTVNDKQRAVDMLIMENEQAQAAVESARAALADSERAYERIKNGPNPDDVAILQARIDAAQATLRLVDLEAPFAGTITSSSLNTNDQVTPGSVAARLDDLSQLLVDVRVSEVDINQVKIGQSVTLNFDAIQGKSYEGQVVEINGSGSATQGVVEFVVTVEISNPDQDVRPGMTAAVNVVVEEFANVLVVPNKSVRVADGQRVVYVLVNEALEQVRVTLGASSENNSVVLDGSLKVGDTLVLNPPQVFDSNGPPPFVRR